MGMVILCPSLFKALTTVTSKIDERKENVYSINMLSVSAPYLPWKARDLHHPNCSCNWLKVVFSACKKAVDSVNVAR